MENNNELKHANLFGNNTSISLDERVRVINELNKIGSLTFKLSTSGDGWVAQCDEVPGIIAGNTNPNPTSSEVESQIRDSIFAAFSIKIKEEDTSSPYFTYSEANRVESADSKFRVNC